MQLLKSPLHTLETSIIMNSLKIGKFFYIKTWVYVGAISADYEALSIEAVKATTADEMICCIAEKLELATPDNFELAEVIGNAEGQECKERRLAPNEQPVKLMLLWPKLKGSRCSDEEEIEAQNILRLLVEIGVVELASVDSARKQIESMP
ncbi:hypothetical protein QYM36_019079 [Artemia franciscana]|uniref:Ras-associating domain-containing protein n=1 Tax=Artemia franciscana TaxID=6661 RepID=A0AA88H1M2_ARTSF|nr:hypothetical protein QYM36_019079 [Artemia franciscana]